MQSLDVISINLWQILISLCNLLLLFLVLKKFLYQPVRRVMAERQAALDRQYAEAAEAQQKAENDRLAWEAKMQDARSEADHLLKAASERAGRREEQIVSEAKEKAEQIVKNAEDQAALEHKKSRAGIRKEIVEVSAVLTEKLVGHEIHPEDHRAIIDSVISEIGENHDDGDQ